MASTARSSFPKPTEEVAGMLRQFIEAVESGELLTTTPQDVAVVRRLEGALASLDAVVGGRVEGHNATG
jgi:hypothetical protein